MKKLLILCLFILTSCGNKKEVNQIAEISCGQCQFGFKNTKGCDLAVKIDEKIYFVDGAHIDDFGDAHDQKIGFCNVIRKATIVGKIEGGRFKASSVELVE